MKVFNFGTPLNPEVPTLQEQAKQAMNVQTPQFDPNQPVPPQEEVYDPSNIDHITRGNEYISALEAILANAKPQLDPEKEKRYKQRAAISSFGQGLKTIFDGISHTQGMNVLPDQNQNATYSNAALAKLQDDYKTKMETYNNMLTQGKLQGLNYLEHMKDAADKYKYMWNVNKQNNKQRDKEFNADQEYKNKALTQANDQFVKQLAQQLAISEATLKQRKGESELEHAERLAAISAQRENNQLDFEAAIGKQNSKNIIHFTNKTTGRQDAIPYESAVAIANKKIAEIEAEHIKDGGKKSEDHFNQNSLYNRLNKFRTGGLTPLEAQILTQELYDQKTSFATKQFSANDVESYGKHIDPYSGKQIPNGTKSRGSGTTSKPSQGIDVSKYGGKVGFGN